MEAPKNGGQAFPCYNRGYDGNWDKIIYFEGMSLRDYFAAKVIQGQASLPDERTMGAGGHSKEEVENWRQGLLEYDVAYAYRVADAMIEARNK